MTDEYRKKPDAAVAHQPAARGREERLASALRDNLRRRKAQARGRRHLADDSDRHKV